MPNSATGLFLLLSLTAPLCAQVSAPAGVSSASGPRLFSPDGAFHYALTASNSYETGDAVAGGSVNLTTFSGDLSYSSPSESRPFQMLYTGGWRASSSSVQPSASFHTLALKQGFNLEKWVVSVSNQFSYLPESPSTGLSGIPGIGDIGLQSVQAPPAQPADLLSNFATLIDDSLTGQVTRQIDFHTYFTGTATWESRLFLEGNGLDTKQVGGTAGVNRRLSARSDIGVNYAFSRFSYSALGFSFITDGVNLVSHHQWSRTLSTSVSVGPQWTISSDAQAVPSATNLAVNANASYARRLRRASISYSRGSVGGSGVVPGAFSDSVQGSMEQSFHRTWALALTGSYTRLSGNGSGNSGGSGITNSGTGTSRYIGLQCSRALGHSFSAYASYTAQFQSLDSSLTVRNALNGVSQIIGAGVTFSPQSKHLGQL
jgi:outer membrane scaffolding protein for murein synthesis (MipA/OmpV family)